MLRMNTVILNSTDNHSVDECDREDRLNWMGQRDSGDSCSGDDCVKEATIKKAPAKKNKKHKTRKTRSIFDSYEIDEQSVLGEGCFANVFKARHKRTEERFAVKDVAMWKLEDKSCLRDEIDILQSLRHPSIVELYDVYEGVEHTYLVMEECRGGDLISRIEDKEFYDEKLGKELCFNLLQAINHCHRLQIAHRDLKPDNILLVEEDNDVQIKVIDFGLARRVTSPNCLKSFVGTPDYVAPEVLDGDNGYDHRADMWSVGVILYIILGGYPPFETAEAIVDADYQFHEKYWKTVSSQAKDLIRAMLQVDTEVRITAAQALVSDWILDEEPQNQQVAIDTATVQDKSATATIEDIAPDVKPLETKDMLSLSDLDFDEENESQRKPSENKIPESNNWWTCESCQYPNLTDGDECALCGVDRFIPQTLSRSSSFKRSNSFIGRRSRSNSFRDLMNSSPCPQKLLDEAVAVLEDGDFFSPIKGKREKLGGVQIEIPAPGVWTNVADEFILQSDEEDSDDGPEKTSSPRKTIETAAEEEMSPTEDSSKPDDLHKAAKEIPPPPISPEAQVAPDDKVPKDAKQAVSSPPILSEESPSPVRRAKPANLQSAEDERPQQTSSPTPVSPVRRRKPAYLRQGENPPQETATEAPAAPARNKPLLDPEDDTQKQQADEPISPVRRKPAYLRPSNKEQAASETASCPAKPPKPQNAKTLPPPDRDNTTQSNELLLKEARQKLKAARAKFSSPH